MKFEESVIRSQADIEAGLEYLIATDVDLKTAYEIVKEAGTEIPLRLRQGGFEGLAELVISQLVSKASAQAIYGRFVQLINPATPQNYLDAGPLVWKAIGLSRPKQTALQNICDALIKGNLDLTKIPQTPVKQAMEELTAVKGIGPWTAQVYLLFCVGHRDIFPAGDLALREAARVIWSLENRPDEKELEECALKWAPWRGVAARLLWAYYSRNKGKNNVAP